MQPPWQVTNEKVDAVIGRIVRLCGPRRIILFGSYVRGETDVDSDLDILIVSREPVSNPRKEAIRIRRGLRGIRMPMDILVIGENDLTELAHVPGLVYREALRGGRVVYESTA